jgi:1-acyl-sn-glycerol-3-phosphate acyltransferase
MTYGFCRTLCMCVARVFFRVRVQGAEAISMASGVLVCSNHQSFLDPVIVGMTCRRQMNFLGRETLFRNRMFSAFIRFLNAIPIQREGTGIGGLKETLKRLKRSEAVLMFPEGTRTNDGSIRDLKPGFCALVRRGKVPILPVALDGAYDAWPRHRKLPRFSKLAVCFGEPIDLETIARLDDTQLIVLVTERIAACLDRARDMRK